MARKYQIELNDFDEIRNDEKYIINKKDRKEKKETRKKGKKLIDEYKDERGLKDIKQKATVIVPVVIGVLILALVVVAIIITSSLNSGKIYAGIYFNNQSLYGMTKSEVKEFVTKKYITPFKEKELIISYNGESIKTTMFDFTITPDSDRVAEEAYNVARHGNIFTRLIQVMNLKSKPVNIQFVMDINNDKLTETVDKLNEQVFEQAINPSYTLLPNSVTFKGGKNGMSVNTEKLRVDLITAIADLLENKLEDNTARITAEIKTDRFTPLSESEIFNKIFIEATDAGYNKVSKTELVITESAPGQTVDREMLKDIVNRINQGENIVFEELPITEVLPTVTTEQLYKTVLTYVMSSSSSKNTNDDDVTDITRMQERDANIRKAVEALNGIVLLPNEVFDFWNELGLISEEFIPAYDNSSAAMEKVLGGGISQVASCIYLAVFTTDMPVSEHHCYPYTVNYGPLGLDAHVVKDSKNLIFTNTYDFPVRLEITYVNDMINVKIIGTNLNDGKSIQHTVRSTPISYETEYIEDPELDEGTEILQQGGIVGYEVKVYKKRLINGVELISEYITTEIYEARKEIIIRGTKPIEDI